MWMDISCIMCSWPMVDCRCSSRVEQTQATLFFRLHFFLFLLVLSYFAFAKRLSIFLEHLPMPGAFINTIEFHLHHNLFEFWNYHGYLSGDDPRLRDVASLVWGHTAGEKWSWVQTQGCYSCAQDLPKLHTLNAGNMWRVGSNWSKRFNLIGIVFGAY